MENVKEREEEEEAVRDKGGLLSAEMWFPLPLTPTSCLCYFCRNLYIFPHLSRAPFLFLFLVVFSCLFQSLLILFICLLFCLPLLFCFFLLVKSGLRLNVCSYVHHHTAITDWISTKLVKEERLTLNSLAGLFGHM